MRPENAAMQRFLADNGLPGVRVSYVRTGTLKGCWSVYRPGVKWSPEAASALSALGFVGFDDQPLGQYSGNGGQFSVLVRGHYELLEVAK